ncbi:MAG TPA: succinate--CoA ligase subunit alpha [Anaerolineae bacterium]|nr:succinate--CoA ligase subunit alpha [Anaerolineae bacterium]
MSILINKETRLLVQGITGQEGLFHTQRMKKYGTNIVAGVTPGKGGGWALNGKIPVFDTVHSAVEATGVNTSVIFVPARFALDAIYESIDAGLSLIVCITKGIPVQDTIRIRSYMKNTSVRLIGPNTPGVINPGESKVGIIPDSITAQGNIGVVSRSGTLTYEVLYVLQKGGLGVSTCVGIGGDLIVGSGFIDILDLFEQDPYTEEIVLIGEIGGEEEQIAANFISSNMTKPVVAFIAGQTAPQEKRMGHAGAIIGGRIGRAVDKINSLKNSGVQVAKHLEEIPSLLQKL